MGSRSAEEDRSFRINEEALHPRPKSTDPPTSNCNAKTIQNPRHGQVRRPTQPRQTERAKRTRRDPQQYRPTKRPLPRQQARRNHREETNYKSRARRHTNHYNPSQTKKFRLSKHQFRRANNNTNASQPNPTYLLYSRQHNPHPTTNPRKLPNIPTQQSTTTPSQDRRQNNNTRHRPTMRLRRDIRKNRQHNTKNQIRRAKPKKDHYRNNYHPPNTKSLIPHK